MASSNSARVSTAKEALREDKGLNTVDPGFRERVEGNQGQRGGLLGYVPGCDTETALLLWRSWLWVCVRETGLGVFPPSNHFLFI